MTNTTPKVTPEMVEAAMLTENPDERRMFNSDVELHGGPLCWMATQMRIWATMQRKMSPGGSFGEQLAIMANELMKIKRATPPPPAGYDTALREALEQIEHRTISIQRTMDPEALYAGAKYQLDRIRDIARAALAQAGDGWRPIETAPRNDGRFRLYGVRVRNRNGFEFFEAYYVAEDDEGKLIEPGGDWFSDWSFKDFEVWCDAPQPPPPVITGEGRGSDGSRSGRY